MLSAIAMARLNGVFDEGGVIDICDPRLAKSVAKLCLVRKHSPGDIATQARLDRYFDEREYESHHAADREAKLKTQNDLASRRAEKMDTHLEVQLASSVGAYKEQVEAFGGKIGQTVTYLKDQFHGRTSRKRSYPATVLGSECRAKNGSLKMASSNGEKQLPYLLRVVEKMVAHDSDLGFPEEHAGRAKIVRETVEIAPQHTSSLSKAVKKEQLRVLTEKTQPKDDPLCLQLRQEYLGKILLDFDEEPHLTYKAIDITFYDTRKPHCWEATCVPVENEAR
jgi:hypothetical protein